MSDASVNQETAEMIETIRRLLGFYSPLPSSAKIEWFVRAAGGNIFIGLMDSERGLLLGVGMSVNKEVFKRSLRDGNFLHVLREIAKTVIETGAVESPFVSREWFTWSNPLAPADNKQMLIFKRRCLMEKERKGLGLTVMDGIKFGLGMLIANIIALLVAGVLLIVLMLFGVIATSL